MELIIQRLKSKTYWAAIVGALLSILEVNYSIVTQFIPVPYRSYAIMLWPLVMVILREITTTALSAKTPTP